MAVIQAQQIPRKQTSADDIVARFCYLFPQYTFKEAKKLPAKRLIQMIGVAEKYEAQRFLLLLRIVAAPHTKDGSGYKRIEKDLQNIINA